MSAIAASPLASSHSNWHWEVLWFLLERLIYELFHDDLLWRRVKAWSLTVLYVTQRSQLCVYLVLHRSMLPYTVMCLWIQQITVVWTWGLVTHTLSLSPSQAANRNAGCELAGRPILTQLVGKANLSWSSLVERFEDDSDWHQRSMSNLWLTRLPLYSLFLSLLMFPYFFTLSSLSPLIPCSLFSLQL